MEDVNKSNNSDTQCIVQKAKGTNNSKNAIKDKVQKNLRELSGSSFLLKNGSIQIQSASNIHLGNNVSLVNASASNNNSKPAEVKPEITPAVLELLESQDDISNLHRLAVDCQVGSDWRLLGVALAGFSNSQMDQLEEPFKAQQYPFREMIFQLVLQWESQCEVKPTVGMLANALWKCKMYSAFISLLEVVKTTKK